MSRRADKGRQGRKDDRVRRIAVGMVTLLALAAIGLGLSRLLAPLDGLEVAPLRVAEIPALVYRKAAGGPAPVVVIAHGFAGSQQMMQPFATTLAQAGFVAVTFDFPGHGGDPTPLSGGLSGDKAAAGGPLEGFGRGGRGARPPGGGRVGRPGPFPGGPTRLRL